MPILRKVKRLENEILEHKAEYNKTLNLINLHLNKKYDDEWLKELERLHIKREYILSILYTDGESYNEIEEMTGFKVM